MTIPAPPNRPLLRWHGGKWLQAPGIIANFPPHRVYVEPFGGAVSVLLRKAPSYAEVWNDLDGELVNLFRVLRDPTRAARLIELLRLTPYARDDFNASYRPARSGIERARQMILRSFAGHGSDGASGQYRTGFRANSNRSGSTPAHDWQNYPEALAAIVARINPAIDPANSQRAGVIVENRDALKVMATHDSPETLHYVDPPYLAATRARANRRPDNGGVYRHELCDSDHADLLNFLRELSGMVVLSGYPDPSYDAALPDWHRIERAARADGALKRIEVLWLNPACAAKRPAPGLFGEAA